MIDAKPLHIRFDKMDAFIRVYNGIRYYLVVKNMIYYRIRYLIGAKSGITYVISHNYVKIKVGSYNYLPLQETLTIHNVIIFIKSVFNKGKNSFYHNIFLEKLLMNYLKNKFLQKI